MSIALCWESTLDFWSLKVNKEVNTAFDPNLKFSKNTKRTIAQLEYAHVIGGIMYAMHRSRSDIASS